MITSEECKKRMRKETKRKKTGSTSINKISKDMDDRVNATINYAKPSYDKQKHLNDKINGDVDKFGNKLFDDYDKNRQKLDGELKNAQNSNLRSLHDKTRAATMGKLKEKEEIDNKMRESMAYNQNEEKKRRELEEQKNLYRETLQNQMTLNALNKHNYGKMTMQEKYLNRLDLKAYKNKERNTVKAMIPGIKNIPSIGTKPLMRGAMNVMDFSDSPPHGPTGRKGQMFFSPEPRRPEGIIEKPSYASPLPHQPSNMRNFHGTIQRSNTPESTMQRNAISKTNFEQYKQSSRNGGLVGANTARNTQSMASMYNPIVFPVDKSYKIDLSRQ
mmetsp:Transcript_39954/g.39526  ORF Transcript_39954/g.39526 Transcript_39954/m.39526 type:complete len:330 (-) Transcript_39954:27-1016(-)